jgi:hypothetical protein
LRTFGRTSLHPFITIIRAELFDFSTVRPIWLARQALTNGWILSGNFGCHGRSQDGRTLHDHWL